ncbi:unnamed protein product [Kluyveromyces dobzhanskii CBS 2104]|uniref:WGS project CCBQ000000000 data, contig 00266 n=1 Tax=Kluyveromyces dobzhanskii CBS 2104 TaxID=1427455 RepID=A0A0A8L765_9SACH|nr:unnamed protein product [Kluyveromyces dobzhanskii CBS 2104]
MQADIDHSYERLVFVGDVHGMYEKYEELMERKVEPDSNTTVIFLGDFISKGPNSNQLVEQVVLNSDLDYNVKCVLGNNELKIMYAMLNPMSLVRRKLNKIRFSSEDFQPDLDSISKNHRRLARELGWDNLSQLASKCGALWQLTDPSYDNFTLLAVHAGVLPEHISDPPLKEITDMKYVDKKDHSHTARRKFKNSMRWYKLWNPLNREKYHIRHKVEVIYGHDSATGLNIRQNTKGLDSACYDGNELTALEYKWNHKEQKYKHVLHQVSCKS